MTKRLTRYHVIAGVLAIAVVFAAGSLIGSNMGFKMVRDYDNVAGSLSMYGVALPHNNPWTGSAGDDSTNFLNDHFPVSKAEIGLRWFDNSINAFREHTIYEYCPTWTTVCSTLTAGVPFEFNVGEAYFWRAGGSTKGATLVGSQDPTWPAAPVEYEKLASSISMYAVALTPNTKWTTSTEVLNGWFPATNTGFGFRRWDNGINAWQEHSIYEYCPTWTTVCSVLTAGVPFGLNPGEGYMVRVDPPDGAKVQRSQEPYY
jgi:hypothetical protein